MARFLAEPPHEHGIAFVRPSAKDYPILKTYIEEGGAGKVVETQERSETEEEQRKEEDQHVVGDKMKEDM
jgi:hypothetical protein